MRNWNSWINRTATHSTECDAGVIHQAQRAAADTIPPQDVSKDTDRKRPQTDSSQGPIRSPAETTGEITRQGSANARLATAEIAAISERLSSEHTVDVSTSRAHEGMPTDASNATTASRHSSGQPQATRDTQTNSIPNWHPQAATRRQDDSGNTIDKPDHAREESPRAVADPREGPVQAPTSLHQVPTRTESAPVRDDALRIADSESVPPEHHDETSLIARPESVGFTYSRTQPHPEPRPHSLPRYRDPLPGHHLSKAPMRHQIHRLNTT